VTLSPVSPSPHQGEREDFEREVKPLFVSPYSICSSGGEGEEILERGETPLLSILTKRASHYKGV